MRKGEKDRSDDDANRAVNAGAKHQFFQNALRPEQIDQRNAGQQRRHKNGGHGNQPKQPFEPHATAVQRIGKPKRQRDGNDGADHRDH